MKAKEDKKTQKELANQEKNTENNLDNLKSNLNTDNSLHDFISQFKNMTFNNSNFNLDSLDNDIKPFVYFYLFTYLIHNDSTSIESFRNFDWLLIYQSFNKHFDTFDHLLKNNLQNNDIVSDLIYQANLQNNDIDIDVKLHIINGQKVLIDSQNVCYHFNHHKPIGKLLNNIIVEF